MSLIQKWVELVASVDYIQKRGRNDYHKYTYVTEEDLLDVLRPKMAELGLVFYPSSAEVIDNSGSVITIRYTYTLVDAETGEAAHLQVIAQGADSQDKGAYKAATGARKYALRQLVLVSTGDDPERDDDSLDKVAKNPNAVLTIRKLKQVGIDYQDPKLEEAISSALVDIPNNKDGTALLKQVYKMAMKVENGAAYDAALTEMKEALNG